MKSKIILEKENGGAKRLVVLRGVRHVAPKESYADLQAELDRVVRDDYLLLIERLENTPNIPIHTKNGRRLKEIFGRGLRRSYRRLAQKRDEVYQEKRLKYPPQAIVVDMTLQDFVNLLDRNGIGISWAKYHILLPCMIAKKSKKVPMWLNILGVLLGRKRLGKHISAWFGSLIREARPFALNYRNEVIFAKAMAMGGNKNLFLLYGEKHLPGLCEIFERGGWTVKERS